MFKHIEKLRNKSDAEKLRFIFGASATATLVIALFWVVALVFRLENGGLSFEINTPQNNNLKDIGSKIGGSWDQFFPKDDGVKVSTTSQATTTDYVAPIDTVPSDDVAAPVDGPYPADIN
ncbi:MAG: hypothetical protein WC763_01440 [Candidatus Paceibacterota bacterium]|jgi:uncharacterized membrane protein